MPSVLVFLFGVVFTTAGAALVFGRSGIILDRARGRIVQWYGLLVPMKHTEYLMDAVDQVEMNFSSGDSDSAPTWPVKISGRSISKPISISQPTSFTEARQLAEELSCFLQKPLIDSSTGESIIRDPDHLNESYKDRMRRTGEAVGSLPPEPPNMRSRVEQTGEGIIIHIAAKANGLNYIPVFAPVIFAVFVAWFFMPAIFTRSTLNFISYIFLSIIVLSLISALLKMYRLKKEFEQVTVTKAFLRVEALKQGKRLTSEIPIDELEDFVAPTAQGAINTIEVTGMKKVPLGDTGAPRMPGGRPVPSLLLSLMKMVGSKGIIARSDKAVMEFARGLDEAEVAYLFALIRKTLAE